MAKRRKTLKLEACKVNLRKVRALGPNALMKVWSRVSNLATAKMIARSKPGAMHATPQERRHAITIYAKIARKLEKE